MAKGDEVTAVQDVLHFYRFHNRSVIIQCTQQNRLSRSTFGTKSLIPLMDSVPACKGKPQLLQCSSLQLAAGGMARMQPDEDAIRITP
ncbi:hypothetical protein Y1Q_0006909 [Alligator mississippiensis]|uniref:Uncharacterized protein n=1 Tax=Alligator mississippiensis TaxID=8496 RepID=A0A151MUH1_ALLMI|nr:hypothetical protein Y1Q_0006909 [Alligator mississippiensis]